MGSAAVAARAAAAGRHPEGVAGHPHKDGVCEDDDCGESAGVKQRTDPVVQSVESSDLRN